jgi:hypothetical protein
VDAVTGEHPQLLEALREHIERSLHLDEEVSPW